MPGEEPDSYDFIEYDSAGLEEKYYEGTDEIIQVAPEFDIKVEAEKINPFSQMANNEMAIQLYQIGFFNPQRAIEAKSALSMMDFEGVEQIKKQINKNDALMQQLTRTQEKVKQLEQIIMNGQPQQQAPQQAPGQMQ